MPSQEPAPLQGAHPCQQHVQQALWTPLLLCKAAKGSGTQRHSRYLMWLVSRCPDRKEPVFSCRKLTSLCQNISTFKNAGRFNSKSSAPASLVICYVPAVLFDQRSIVRDDGNCMPTARSSYRYLKEENCEAILFWLFEVLRLEVAGQNKAS